MVMELIWLEQGGFLVRCGDIVVCLDPYRQVAANGSADIHASVRRRWMSIA